MKYGEAFTDEEIVFIASFKEATDLGWADIADKYNKRFRKEKNQEAIRNGYNRNKDRLSETNEYVKTLRDVARTKKNNSLNSKDLKKVIEEWEKRENWLDAVKSAAKEIGKANKKPIKLPRPSKDKKPMTLELLISDVHVGKQTETFDLSVLKRRLHQIADTTVKEIQRASQQYKVERIVVALLGDLIESATMHGNESAKGCEFGNSRQVQECITNMFHIVLKPIFSLGIKVDVVGVTGNHDRTEQNRTYHNPGEENLTYIIYKTLEEFTKISDFKNVSWEIPSTPYQVIDIYGEKVLYEHFDNAKGNTRAALEALLARRINQLKIPINFMRGGHFHEPTEFGLGKIVTNGSVPGDDSYSDVLGFRCEPTQTLNFYIKRDRSDTIKRQSSFFKRFLIQLD